MLLCNHQYEWFENFLQMFRGFLRDVKLIFKLMLHIDTYNKTNMMLKKNILYHTTFTRSILFLCRHFDIISCLYIYIFIFQDSGVLSVNIIIV